MSGKVRTGCSYADSNRETTAGNRRQGQVSHQSSGLVRKQLYEKRAYYKQPIQEQQAARKSSHITSSYKVPSHREALETIGTSRPYIKKCEQKILPVSAGRPFLVVNYRKILIFLAVSLILLFAGVGFCSGMMPSGLSVAGANQPIGDVHYKVVEIERGDSLWTIAQENMTPGFSNIYEYIAEIKRCNQLSSDRITAGHYLMIPYYEELV